MSLDHDALEPELERIATDLDDLARFRDSAQPGWTRTVFSDAYRGSRQWTAELMRSAGMDVHSDPRETSSDAVRAVTGSCRC